jgi:predicted Zn-dependent protease with MMP-like domain
MEKDEFVKEVELALDRLPEEFRRRIHNVEIVVEKRPSKRRLREMDLDPEEDVLYGLYEGVPLSERSVSNPPLLPDKITIFSEPLTRDFPDAAERRSQIHLTVLHEIAHYFGMDDEEIEDLGY